MERNFDIKTSLFRLPTGTSPQDPENINTVKRIMKSATGAENVDISLHQGPSGNLLTDLYNVNLEFPTLLADGAYVSLKKKGKLEGETVNLLAEIIKTLGSGGDAKPQIQKLLSVVSKSPSGEGVPGEEDPLGEEGPGPGAGAGDSPFPTSPGSDDLGLDGGPGSEGPVGPEDDEEKKKNPFASVTPKNKNNRLRRAMVLESKLRIPIREGVRIVKSLKTANFDDFVARTAAVQGELDIPAVDAIEIVQAVDSSNHWKEWHKKASSMLLDENDKPLSPREYNEIAKIARGEATAPLA